MDLTLGDDDESRVILLVHDTKPPFLTGKAIYVSVDELDLLDCQSHVVNVLAGMEGKCW